jgi:DhnA family fructose-bisphosphate aldolase class Ia
VSALLSTPALVLAADHRARGIVTVERYADYLGALRAALPSCDGVLASMQPLRDLVADGIGAGRRSYLSLNRTGLAGSVFETDDRLVATVEQAAEEGVSGVKHMTRIDRSDPATAGGLELLGRVLDEANVAGLEAMVEAVGWRDGRMRRDPDGVVMAAVIAHDMGAPLLKVPIPDVAPGPARADAVARVVASVGVPVLFLGGPRAPRAGPEDGATGAGGTDGADAERRRLLDEARDVMAGGAGGLAVGRAILGDPSPGEMAAELAAIVHGA